MPTILPRLPLDPCLNIIVVRKRLFWRNAELRYFGEAPAGSCDGWTSAWRRTRGLLAQESLPRETNNLPQPKTGALGPGLTQTAPPTSTSRYFSRYLTQTRRISFQKQAVWCVVPIAMAANRRRGRAERQRRRSEEVPVMRLALLGRAVSMD